MTQSYDGVPVRVIPPVEEKAGKCIERPSKFNPRSAEYYPRLFEPESDIWLLVKELGQCLTEEQRVLYDRMINNAIYNPNQTDKELAHGWGLKEYQLTNRKRSLRRRLGRLVA